MKRLLCSLFLLVVFVMGCSKIMPTEGTPAAKITVLNVASRYLTYIVYGQTNQLGGMISWIDYVPAKQATLNRDRMDALVRSFNQHYPPDDNPLSNLDVSKLTVIDNEANIVLKKQGIDTAPKIELQLRWTGTQWMIANDNLFGPGELIPTLIEAKQQR